MTVTVNGTPLTVDLTTPGAPGQAPGQVIPVTAAKTWVAYTVTISPSANNPVGTQHDFTITATVTRRDDDVTGGERVDRVHAVGHGLAGHAESVYHECGGDVHRERDVAVGGDGHVAR